MDNRSYYDTFSETYEHRRDERYHRFLDESALRLVEPHARDRDVLEIGCGTGLILRHVDPIARRAVGIDLSPGMLDHARSRGLEVVEGNATELPFDDASFDLAYSFKVLAHVEAIGDALTEIARVTRPGGRAVLDFYNAASLRALVKRVGPTGRIGRAGDARESDVFTRFDRLSDIVGLLPPELALERADGFRILSPAASLFNMPVLGRAWTAVERVAARTPLRRFGGFLVLTLRRR